jgi:hypothetical protein
MTSSGSRAAVQGCRKIYTPSHAVVVESHAIEPSAPACVLLELYQSQCFSRRIRVAQFHSSVCMDGFIDRSSKIDPSSFDGQIIL